MSDARRFAPSVPGMRRAARSLGGMRSGASFIDWTGVYTDVYAEERKRRTTSVIDYVLCASCDQRIAIHKGSGVTHVAGKPYHHTCAKQEQTK